MYNRHYKDFEGKEVWDYAFYPSSNYETFISRTIPVKGIIENNRFYELNKKGKIKKSSGVKASSRYYALTEEEAIREYNNLVDKKISILKDVIGQYQLLKKE